MPVGRFDIHGTHTTNAVMATSTLPTRRQAYRIALALAFGVGAVLTVVVAGPPIASAQADLTLDTLDVAGVDKTVNGNVTDVTVATNIDYQHEVPDATQRIITLEAGPENGTLDTVDYVVHQEPAGTATGTVALGGSLTDATTLTAADVDPSLAATNTTHVTVRATIEVARANGDAVVHTVEDTVAITLTDDASLTATVGGTGNLTVQTDA